MLDKIDLIECGYDPETFEAGGARQESPDTSASEDELSASTKEVPSFDQIEETSSENGSYVLVDKMSMSMSESRSFVVIDETLSDTDGSYVVLDDVSERRSFLEDAASKTEKAGSNQPNTTEKNPFQLCSLNKHLY
jgi:hypothetical protein